MLSFSHAKLPRTHPISISDGIPAPGTSWTSFLQRLQPAATMGLQSQALSHLLACCVFLNQRDCHVFAILVLFFDIVIQLLKLLPATSKVQRLFGCASHCPATGEMKPLLLASIAATCGKHAATPWRVLPGANLN